MALFFVLFPEIAAILETRPIRVKLPLAKHMALALLTVACHAKAGPSECYNSLMEFTLATQSDLLVEEQLVGLLFKVLTVRWYKGLQFYITHTHIKLRIYITY